MDRRKSLKSLIMISGGLTTLPSWALNGWESGDILNISSGFNQQEEKLLRSLVDTIIPTEGDYGGLAQEVDQFLIRLLDQCYPPEVKEQIKQNLKHLESNFQDKHNQSFTEGDQTAREEAFLHFNNAEDEDKKAFFDLIKNETVRGFETSKVIMRKIYHYKVAPGHYYGCVEMKN